MQKPAETTTATSAGETELSAFVARVEASRGELKTEQDFQTDLWKEGHDRGIHTKALKAILTIERMKPHERSEFLAHFDSYRAARNLDAQFSLIADT